MLPWILARYSSDRKRLKRRASLICPDHTGKAIAILIVCVLAFMLLMIGLARAEEDVSIADALGIRETVTEKWQVIRIGKDSTITVWLSRPEPMELGDEISFYCTFDGCHKENFTYNWQYGNGGLWTSFGSNPRKNTTYSSMLAGKEIRLEVKWK